MKINEFCIALFPLILIFFLFLLSCGKALAGNGIEKGHFRFLPELSIYGGYNDNVYRANTNRKSSLFGVLSPAITIDYAIAPQNYFSLHYKGDFEEYTQVDNFRQDHHFGLFKWQWRRPSGTEFQAGTNATDTAVQPYSETQKARSYIQAQAFAEMDLAVGAFSYFGLRYRFVMREFDDQIYSVDNYRKNTFSTDFTYGYFKRFPLLLEYQFLTQDNNDAPDALSPDFTTHTILAGGYPARFVSVIHPAARIRRVSAQFPAFPALPWTQT